MPIGAYGVSAGIAERMHADDEGDYEDAGGVGGTLAGNAFPLAAARATLEHVLTESAFERMMALQERFAGVRATIERHGLPWCVVELRARRGPPRPSRRAPAAGRRRTRHRNSRTTCTWRCSTAAC